MMRLVGIAALLMAACTHDRATNTAGEAAAATAPGPSAAASGGGRTTSLPVITTQAEAKVAIGQRVRVPGIAEHDKLGDAVSSKSFSVICLEPRFPPARLDKPIEVEGVLELTDEFQATQEPNGIVSQGTMPGTSSYVIRVCTVR